MYVYGHTTPGLVAIVLTTPKVSTRTVACGELIGGELIEWDVFVVNTWTSTVKIDRHLNYEKNFIDNNYRFFQCE